MFFRQGVHERFNGFKVLVEAESTDYNQTILTETFKFKTLKETEDFVKEIDERPRENAKSIFGTKHTYGANAYVTEHDNGAEYILTRTKEYSKPELGLPKENYNDG